MPAHGWFLPISPPTTHPGTHWYKSEEMQLLFFPSFTNDAFPAPASRGQSGLLGSNSPLKRQQLIEKSEEEARWRREEWEGEKKVPHLRGSLKNECRGTLGNHYRWGSRAGHNSWWGTRESTK